jgi:GntR family transcriptional regulator, rspAB operon transcriptional repressor
MVSTQHEVAYQHIKTRILNLQFKPGQVLYDSKIASELAISRTPVREAFLRLKSEGLLEYEAHKGWRVYLLTLADLHEIFDLKEAVEGLVSRKAADCQEINLRLALREALSGLVPAASTESPECWFEADNQLHQVICQMAQNQRAFNVLKSLNDQWHRLRVGFMFIQSRKERSIDEYRLIVDCILAGDGAQAEKLTQNHLHNVREELIELLVKFILPYVEEGV